MRIANPHNGKSIAKYSIVYQTGPYQVSNANPTYYLNYVMRIANPHDGKSRANLSKCSPIWP